jgi:CRP/FNR family transcriptional regulator, cyclic AMP receptor protein
MTRPQDRPAAGSLSGYAALSDFPIFAAVRAEGIAALSAAVTRRSWPAGSMIFQRGDAGDHLLAIRRGRVRLSLSSPQGREVVLRAAGPGEVLGEMALIDGLPRSADAFAAQDTECLVLSRSGFQAVAQRYPDVPMAMAQYLCSLLRSTNHQLESIAMYELQARLARFFLYLLKQKHGEDIPPAPTLRHGLNQSDLSAILGASRPKVNQALQALVSLGTIRPEGEALLCDLRMLRQLAQET